VLFSDSPEVVNGSGAARSHFDAEPRTIHAVFPTAGIETSAVMVRWARIDSPNILAFDRYAISPGQQQGLLSVDRGAGWDPGRYRVDVFTGDERMTQIAAGEYVVDEPTP